MSRDRGFVLVNALLIVAALAAAAVFLLARADSGRVRLEARQGAAQLGAYLDAFEALAITQLNRDARTGAVDHAGEDWARPIQDVTLDRGRVTGRLRDEQALFNLNWLADQGNTQASEAFDALASRIGISPSTGDAIRAFLRPGGPEQRALFRRQTPPLDPVGGALLMFDQLADVPGIPARDMQRLRQFTTVLPGDSAINVNTVSVEVLTGFLPALRPAMLDSVLRRRRQAPFTSADDFVLVVEAAMGAALDETVDVARFAVGSDWFRVQAQAELEGQTATRTALLMRQSAPRGALVRWRVSTYD
tara:strand:- start:114318 stop:115232 length:915 start_codon:yes stop_codon:yes gene_type:complete